MATRKKKSEVTPETLSPVVVQGTHLTVTTWPDGRTELKWDDEALLREVQAATAGKKPAVKAKTARNKSKETK